MNRQARDLVITVTVVIIAVGLISFFASYYLGMVSLAWGAAIGAGIAILEFDSSAVVLSVLLGSRSKFFWGLLLTSKSLMVLTLVGVLIWVLKINAIGFIIGFSGLVAGITIAGAIITFRPKEGV